MSKLQTQVGYADESQYGTAVTPDRFLPALSVNKLTSDRQRLDSEAIIAGRRTLDSSSWRPGNVGFSGTVQHYLYGHGMGFLLAHALGDVDTNGAGPYTHEFTPGDLTGKSFVYQISNADIGGDDRVFTYAGCKIESWSINLAAGEYGTWEKQIVARSETTATALATATYPTDLIPFTFVDGAVEIGGSVRRVKTLVVNGTTGIKTDRRFIGDPLIHEPLQRALMDFTGTIGIEFENLTDYNRFVNADEVALEIQLDDGTDTLTIESNIRYNGGDPAETDGLYEQSIDWKAIGDDDDESAFTATLVNSDSAP